MADAPDASTPTSPYDRDVLRSQMEALRREAAVRAKLEHEIVAEHDEARAATEKSAREKLAATTQKYTRDIEAAKREYATVLQQIAGQAAAEQKKLDDQRKAFAATILRTAATQQSQLKDDDQYEDASFREICTEKRKDPVRLFAKSEKDLGRTLAHLDEADQKTLQALARWRSSESLAIYARLNPSDYVAWTSKALNQRTDSTTTRRLPCAIDDDALGEQGRRQPPGHQEEE